MDIIDEELLFETDYVKVEFNSDKNYIFVVWKKFANDNEQVMFREKLLEMIKKTKTNSYITDNRKLYGTTENVQKWIRDRWFPAAYEAGLRNVATVETSDKYAQFAINKIMEGEIFKTLNTKHFKTITEAENWITSL